MECPIHARSKPKFTKAYSFGLVTALFFISSWTAQFVFQMISEGNEAANTGSHFAWSDFFRNSFSTSCPNRDRPAQFDCREEEGVQAEA
jgi:hypothetical protein